MTTDAVNSSPVPDGSPVKLSSSTPSAVKSVNAATGTPTKLGSTTNGSLTGSNMDMQTYMTHVASWNEPLLTLKYFVGVFMLFWFTHEGEVYEDDGSSYKTGYSYVTIFTFVLLTRLALVSFPSQLAQTIRGSHAGTADALMKVSQFISTHTEMPGEKTITFWIEGLSDVVENKVLAAVKAYKAAENDKNYMKAVFGRLLGAWVVLSIVSLRTIVFGGIFGLLTVPVVYKKFQVQIDSAYDKFVKPHVETMTKQGQTIGEKAAKQIDGAVNQAKQKYFEFVNSRKAKTK